MSKNNLNPLLFEQIDPRTKTTQKYKVLLSLFIIISIISFFAMLVFIAETGISVLISMPITLVFSAIYGYIIHPEKFNFNQRHFDYWEMENKVAKKQREDYEKTGSWIKAVDTNMKLQKELQKEFHKKHFDYSSLISIIGIPFIVISALILIFF